VLKHRVGLLLRSRYRGVEYCVSSNDISEEAIKDLVKVFGELPNFIDRCLNLKENVEHA